jgi:hypothetical protein
MISYRIVNTLIGIIKSISLVSVLVYVGIFPQISPLSDNFVDIDFEVLLSVDVDLHARPIDLVQILKYLFDSLVEVTLAVLVLHV